MNQELSRQERRALERSGSTSAEKRSNNVWLWMLSIIFVVIAVGAGLAFVGRGNNQPVATDVPMPIDEVDHRLGAVTAPVEIIEYSDFQCPACRSYAGLLQELKKEFGDGFSLIYRHFPLPYHQNAEAAARAAEAAARQGKFWEMHDKLFASQTEWSDVADPKNIFADYAVGLGLSRTRFEIDFSSQEVTDKINRDSADGAQVGVPGTPTFFVNGQMINNPRSREEFAALIKEAASQKQNADQAQN